MTTLTFKKGEKQAEIEIREDEIIDSLSEFIFSDYFSKYDDDNSYFMSKVCAGIRDYLETVTTEEFNSLVDCYYENLCDVYEDLVEWGA